MKARFWAMISMAAIVMAADIYDPTTAFSTCGGCPAPPGCQSTCGAGGPGTSSPGSGGVGSLCPGPECRMGTTPSGGTSGNQNVTPAMMCVINPAYCPKPTGPIDQKPAGGGSAAPSPTGGGIPPADAGAPPNTAAGAASDPQLAAAAVSNPAYQPMVDSYKAGDLKAACSNAKIILRIDPRNPTAGTILYKSCWGEGNGKAGAPAPSQAQTRTAAAGEQPINDGKVQMLRDGKEPDPYFRPTTNFDAGLQFTLSKISDFRKQGRHQDALDAAKEGLKLNPNSADLLNAESYSLNKLKQFQDALAAAAAALRADPKNANAWANMAAAKAGLGDKNGALDALKNAAALDPAFAEAYRRALAGDQTGLFGDGGSSWLPKDTTTLGLGGLVLALLAGIGWLFFKSSHPTVQRLRTFVKITPPPAMPGANSPTLLDGASRANRLLNGVYELGPRIGAGGMGEVFSGTDKSLGRKVAIKKMLPALAAQPKERERFVSEARTVAALHHPNIVDIHAIVEDGADIYLVFEYVEGKTLADIARGAKMPFHDAVKIVKSVAAALEFAHSKDMVHRDLKPANVMIDQHGMVKVMDFGLARSAQDAMTKLQMTSTIVGTPAYMAPEQDNGVVCKQSDVYALGVTLYELLAGGLPFEGGVGTMMAQKLQGAYKSSAQLPAGLPGGFDDFFKRALEPDVKKRIASVKEFTQALDSLTTPSPA